MEARQKRLKGFATVNIILEQPSHGRTENICLNADRLSLDYLIAECIWDPADNGRDDAESLHPELLRHLTRETVERRDFTLRFGRES